MGLHISEVEPLGRLSAEETQQMALDLRRIVLEPWKSNRSVASDELRAADLTAVDVEAVLDKYRVHDPDLSIAQMESAGWFETSGVVAGRRISDGCYGLSQKVADIAHASVLPLMSFDEACGKIRQVRARLDAAPAEIDGVTVNRVFLYGSATRDKNGRDAIGDLDLGVDFGFDARYEGVPDEARLGKALSVWHERISEGDGHLQVGYLKGMTSYFIDMPGKPCVLAHIWQNPRPAPTFFSPEEEERVQNLLRRTQAEQGRARAIATLISGGEPAIRVQGKRDFVP